MVGVGEGGGEQVRVVGVGEGGGEQVRVVGSR